MSGSTTRSLPALGLDRQRATELRKRYQQYRLGQAQAFLHLIPRDGVRPLYAKAREWAVGREQHDAREPMAALLAYLLDTLPLPPFDVWLTDFEGNRFEHTVALSRVPSSGFDAPPAEVDRRTVRHRTRRWSARLELSRDGSRWRGCIAFAAAGADTVESSRAEPQDAFRTTDIFVERDPRVIRNRFREYHEETLRGFLRSVLP